jgi:hypothetical protein
LSNTSDPSTARASLNKTQSTPPTRGESAARRSSIGQDAVDAGDERRKRGSPFLDGPLTEILAVEVREIERDEAGPR